MIGFLVEYAEEVDAAGITLLDGKHHMTVRLLTSAC